MEPVSRIIPIEDLVRFSSAVNWVAGYLDGLGKPPPPFVEQQFAKLEEWISQP